MNFEGIVKNYPIGNIGALSNTRGQRIALYNVPDRGSFNSGLDKYLDRNTILSMVYSNPTILNTLSNNKIPLIVNVDGFKKNVYNHSVDTKNTAIGIYRNLPVNVQDYANIKNIADAALLHDFGKVLIPENILNKNGKLTPEEAKIMHLHSSLSNDLLRTKDIDPETLNIIKYHHQNRQGTGYPIITSDYRPDINTEIVSLADKYSALREKRSYKRQMTPQEAIGILYNEVSNENVRPEIYDALSSYVKKDTQKNNIKTLNNYFGIKNTAPQQSQSTAFFA